MGVTDPVADGSGAGKSRDGRVERHGYDGQEGRVAHDGQDGPLRILFVPSDRFPPFRPAATAIFLHELPHRGHRVDWLVQADDASPEAATHDTGSGFAIVGATDPGRGLVNRLRKHFLNVRHAWRMIPLVRKNRYDVIQAKDNFGIAVIALLVARACRIRFFYWVAYPRAEASIYESRAGMARYPLLYRLRGHAMQLCLYRILLPAADHVFVQSEEMKNDMARKGAAAEKMTPVPSSVNLTRIPYAAGGGRGATGGERGATGGGRGPHSAGERSPHATGSERDRPADEKRVVYLGTLKRVRNLDFVIRSFSLVLASEPRAVLVMIGKGDQDADLAFLKDEAERLGIAASVVFTGHLDMAEAWEHIRGADACLSPIYPTPILDVASPTKLIEYMAMGRPVVANDHPEQSLVIDESGAGVCAPWEERPFADAVLRILRDPDEAAAMGARGRRYVERYRTNRALGDVVERAYALHARRLTAASGSR